MVQVLTLLGKNATLTAATTPTLGKHNSYSCAAGALAPVLPPLTTGAVATALTAGQIVRVKISRSKTDTSTNALTITCAGSDTFEGGGTTQALLAAGEKVVLVAGTVPGGSGPVWIVDDHTTPRDTLDGRFTFKTIDGLGLLADSGTTQWQLRARHITGLNDPAVVLAARGAGQSVSLDLMPGPGGSPAPINGSGIVTIDLCSRNGSDATTSGFVSLRATIFDDKAWIGSQSFDGGALVPLVMAVGPTIISQFQRPGAYSVFLVQTGNASHTVSMRTFDSTFSNGDSGYPNASDVSASGSGGLILSAGAGPIRMIAGGTTTANASILLNSLGTVSLGLNSALATTATDGFVYFRAGAGAPTGVPTARTGQVAMYYDTTGNKFYIYNGGWKGVVLS